MSSDWIEIVPPMKPAEAKAAFDRWALEHSQQRAALRDQDIKQEIMRTTEGTRVRYSIRRSA